ncbi:unnamed protein product [Dovyalis caffra]|uniref:KIB1-4 beta-propeller domain-containing protein n=1 Tax=Dovyalis caffra TaxID=77055 RepID=A0AAV1SNL8_9ROSI|nr:unnamed protein product [Dovyalis caffra]
MISKRLDSRVDILRFRAVCTSWRCSVSLPSFDQELPLILDVPDPISVAALLFQTTISRMELVRKDPNSSSPSLSKTWLVKVGESNYGKLQLFNPLTNQEIKHCLAPLSLDEFMFVELSKAFLLKLPSGSSVFGINKVVLFPVSANSSDGTEFGILAIFHEVELAYWKYGDENWILLDTLENAQYDDIIVYRAQVYVVDRWGTVSWIDSSLNVIQYSPSLYSCGGQKHLVECCGDLYVVDRVYKLDEEWGKWIDVKSLDDKVFVLGMDCSFSFSSREFNGGKGNCIYYVDNDDYVDTGLSPESIHVFHLEDRSIYKLAAIPEFSEIFWPPRNGSSL